MYNIQNNIQLQPLVKDRGCSNLSCIVSLPLKSSETLEDTFQNNLKYLDLNLISDRCVWKNESCELTETI